MSYAITTLLALPFLGLRLLGTSGLALLSQLKAWDIKHVRWILAYFPLPHEGPQAYLLRANATAVRSKLALWGLPSLLVRVLHLHWTWAGHVLRMGASSFQHRAALLGAHSWRWLEAVAQDTDPANLQCWRHPRAGRRCLTWDFWLERFLLSWIGPLVLLTAMAGTPWPLGSWPWFCMHCASRCLTFALFMAGCTSPSLTCPQTCWHLLAMLRFFSVSLLACGVPCVPAAVRSLSQVTVLLSPNGSLVKLSLMLLHHWCRLYVQPTTCFFLFSRVVRSFGTFRRRTPSGLSLTSSSAQPSCGCSGQQGG